MKERKTIISHKEVHLYAVLLISLKLNAMKNQNIPIQEKIKSIKRVKKLRCRLDLVDKQQGEDFRRLPTASRLTETKFKQDNEHFY